MVLVNTIQGIQKENIQMKNLKTVIGIILVGIAICGCQASNTISSEISVNDSEQEVTISDSGVIHIDDNAMRVLATYDDNLALCEFTPTHAVYVKTYNYPCSGPLIGPNGYNCLYSEDGYIYESTTNVIIYDFK